MQQFPKEEVKTRYTATECARKAPPNVRDYCTQEAGTHSGSVSTLLTAVTRSSKAEESSSFTTTSSNQWE
ncbi:hypothetical protein E2C01_021488 [Portunus trituberculatus]|uniref:Uncharacterized protein n=1 Tax=Portunus trituberculatus TaxID=210409 RepID=A0A5B7E4L1_PORTR|nr:hypothetical protein [Portunus trituberculatus]